MERAFSPIAMSAREMDVKVYAIFILNLEGLLGSEIRFPSFEGKSQAPIIMDNEFPREGGTQYKAVQIFERFLSKTLYLGSRLVKFLRLLPQLIDIQHISTSEPRRLS